MAGEAAAIQAARRDANIAWPKRSKKDDGTWGDAAHKKRKSDHNSGHAIDISHDPASGADGDVIAAYAIRDPRVKYVIWNRRIYTRSNPGWRPYSKWRSMPHDKHVHISVTPTGGSESGEWQWTELAKENPPAPPSIDVEGQSKFADNDPKAIAAAQAAAAKKKAPAKKKQAPTPKKKKSGGKRLVMGEPSVLLGREIRKVAHVQTPHTGGGKVAKGSQTVFVGRQQLALARVGDPTTDNLNVKEGEETVLAG
jgi:hypothetical protein